MANELFSPKYLTGKTVYAVSTRNSDHYFLNVGASSYEAGTTSGWGNYTISLTEQDTLGYYRGSLPAFLAASKGFYNFDFFNRVNGTPAGDNWIGSQGIDWSGPSGVDTAFNTAAVAGQTVVDALRHIGATAAGKISGAGTGTETFQDFAGVTSVVVTVDLNGNRTSVTYL